MSNPANLAHRPAVLWGAVAAVVLGAVGLIASWRISRPPAAGRLAFEQTQIAKAAPQSATELKLRFAFQNVGSRSVRILQVESDCTCTTGAPMRDVYLPGEHGLVELVYKPGTRTGLQRGGVVVRTDSPAQPHVPLSFEIAIPEVMKLHASYLLWSADEPLQPKSFTVHTSPNVSVKEVRANAASPHLAVEVAKVTPTEYHVQVTPRAGQRNISSALHVEALLADNQRKAMTAFVRVR